jgi:ABC-2 type transport system permease protein
LLLGNSVALLTKQVNSGSLPTLVIKLTDFTKYPLSIYPVILQVAFTFIVPYAFVSYYPVSFLLEKNSYTWLSFLGPVISTLFFIVSIRVFEFGLEKYEGSGN